MEGNTSIDQIENLLATELKRLDKMDTHLEKMDTQILIGWIMAGASIATAMLALYTVISFH